MASSVTEAKVQIEGRIGIGIIAGDEPEAARDLAIMTRPTTPASRAPGWERKLIAEEARMTRRETGRGRAGRPDAGSLRVHGSGVRAMRFDPVHDAQKVFRKMLAAAASPGSSSTWAKKPSSSTSTFP